MRALDLNQLRRFWKAVMVALLQNRKGPHAASRSTTVACIQYAHLLGMPSVVVAGECVLQMMFRLPVC